MKLKKESQRKAIVLLLQSSTTTASSLIYPKLIPSSPFIHWLSSLLSKYTLPYTYIQYTPPPPPPPPVLLSSYLDGYHHQASYHGNKLARFRPSWVSFTAHCSWSLSLRTTTPSIIALPVLVIYSVEFTVDFCCLERLSREGLLAGSLARSSSSSLPPSPRNPPPPPPATADRFLLIR
ncbi:uncharacterized protein BO72DRAFT_48659 [Aspergillus fijiensis CBS 313.89]|uniref:Uncharacterized protein n=1 Tax=Aspergillus fijiensis CBS 313.89 TaxID=1448319 RepID=A0A8G1VSB7_9EURO|nr:uncharacterized protein BO72DRAFT_48659 [Aspergillus fijiensis CBS 313.89]RAK70862.1 hypothetical protein BO72DRAFT_48659 [Aspergillus fijiensis CBS 313.89]